MFNSKNNKLKLLYYIIILLNNKRGVDNRNLNSENNERKSISAEITWGIRFSNNDQFKVYYQILI